MSCHQQSLLLGAFLVTSGLTITLKSRAKSCMGFMDWKYFAVLIKAVNWSLSKLLMFWCEFCSHIWYYVFPNALYLLGTSIGFLETSGRSQKLAFLPSKSRKSTGMWKLCSSSGHRQLRVLQARITMLLVKYGKFASKRARFGRESPVISVTYFPCMCSITELPERSIFDIAGPWLHHA